MTPKKNVGENFIWLLDCICKLQRLAQQFEFTTFVESDYCDFVGGVKCESANEI